MKFFFGRKGYLATFISHFFQIMFLRCISVNIFIISLISPVRFFGVLGPPGALRQRPAQDRLQSLWGALRGSLKPAVFEV